MGRPGRAALGDEVVVVSASNSWDDVRMADHQLADALSTHLPVLYVDPCSSAVSRARQQGWRAGLQRAQLTSETDRVARLRPNGLPGLTRPAVARVNRRLVARQVQHALRELGARAAVAVDANPLAPTLDLLPAGRHVYWAQDDYVGLAR